MPNHPTFARNRWLRRGYRYLADLYPPGGDKSDGRLADEAALNRIAGDARMADVLSAGLPPDEPPDSLATAGRRDVMSALFAIEGWLSVAARNRHVATLDADQLRTAATMIRGVRRSME